MMWRREIDLEDMLSDPIVQALMRADGVDRDAFDDLLTRVARARRNRKESADGRMGKGA